jgi:hypothetical protein
MVRYLRVEKPSDGVTPYTFQLHKTALLVMRAYLLYTLPCFAESGELLYGLGMAVWLFVYVPNVWTSILYG